MVHIFSILERNSCGCQVAIDSALLRINMELEAQAVAVGTWAYNSGECNNSSSYRKANNDGTATSTNSWVKPLKEDSEASGSRGNGWPWNQWKKGDAKQTNMDMQKGPNTWHMFCSFMFISSGYPSLRQTCALIFLFQLWAPHSKQAWNPRM